MKRKLIAIAYMIAITVIIVNFTHKQPIKATGPVFVLNELPKVEVDFNKYKKVFGVLDHNLYKLRRTIYASILETNKEDEEPSEFIAYQDSQTQSPGRLTAYGGVYYYGEQRETYYNLDMSGIVYRAQNEWGLEGEYWIREDGCKMFGDYIIVAANLSVHPRCSLVETSLGTGIVLDTGGFAEYNPTQIDIATDW